jgi:hypothetical protein
LVFVAATLAVVDVVAGDAAFEDVVVVLDPHPAVNAATATSTAGIALIFTKGPFSRSVSERLMQRYYAYLGACGISLKRSRSARPSRPCRC